MINFRNPGKVTIDDSADDLASSAANTPVAETSDDFFSTWDKPTIKRPSNPPSRSTTPGIGMIRTATPLLSVDGSGKVPTRSKSPLSATTAELPPKVIPTLGARSQSTSNIGKKTNILTSKKKMVVKKVDNAEIDFDEAERKAKEEQERIEKLGYDPDAENTVTGDSSMGNVIQPEISILAPTPINPARNTSTSKSSDNKDVDKLGAGVRRLGFGQIGSGGPSSSSSSSSKNISSNSIRSASNDTANSYARDKFAGQKSISSDQFNGTGSFDPQAKAESKARLAQFEGATSLSSDAYHGRPEGGEENEGDYGDLESAAKDLVRKFGITAGDDLETLTNLLGEGANKLQGMSLIFRIILYFH